LGQHHAGRQDTNETKAVVASQESIFMRNSNVV
jgi:hypothetical protein